MKKHLSPALGAMTLACSLFISSCLKPPVILPDKQYFEITGIKGETFAGEKDSVKITYNAKGNPVSLIGSMVSTGYPKFLLGYDAKNRLRVNIGAYEGIPTYELAHQYVYDQQNRIIADSIFYFGQYDPASLTLIPGTSHATFVVNFTYDNQHRITKSVNNRVDNMPYHYLTSSYFYNAAGNAYKIVTQYNEDPPTESFPDYDDKVNPHQLHAVWQFIDQDYSRNNAFVADAYNNYGLPLRVNTGNDKIPGATLLQFPFKTYEISYRH